MLSHANLWLGAISVAHYLGLGPADRTLCVLPLAFDYGQSQLLSTWAAGGQAIGFDYLLPADVRKAVRRHDVSVLAGVPPLSGFVAKLAFTETPYTLDATFAFNGDQVSVDIGYNVRWGSLTEPQLAGARAAVPPAGSGLY